MKKKININIKAYLLGLAPSIFLVFALVLCINAFQYRLTKEDIGEKMSHENVVSSAKYGGVIIYVVESSEYYIAYAFSESMILHRFRLLWWSRYHFDDYATFSVPGKRTYVAVSFDGRNITFPHWSVYGTKPSSRITANHVLLPVSLIFVISHSIYYFAVMKPRKKRAASQN